MSKQATHRVLKFEFEFEVRPPKAKVEPSIVQIQERSEHTRETKTNMRIPKFKSMFNDKLAITSNGRGRAYLSPLHS